MEEENVASIHAKEVTRLWRSWRTIHEMVQDRVRQPGVVLKLTPSFPLSCPWELIGEKKSWR